jgi:hypothetical protein
LPDSRLLQDVFGRIEELLTEYANTPSKSPAAATTAQDNVVEARSRFK